MCILLRILCPFHVHEGILAYRFYVSMVRVVLLSSKSNLIFFVEPRYCIRTGTWISLHLEAKDFIFFRLLARKVYHTHLQKP